MRHYKGYKNSIKSDKVKEGVHFTGPVRAYRILGSTRRVDKDGSYHRNRIDEKLKKAMAELYEELGIEPE